jgi:hypothetical protein
LRCVIHIPSERLLSNWALRRRGMVVRSRERAAGTWRRCITADVEDAAVFVSARDGDGHEQQRKP